MRKSVFVGVAGGALLGGVPAHAQSSSPSATGKPALNTPFCNEPGDVEAWQAAKAKRDAEKAARAAAR